MVTFERAQRRNAKARILLAGPSGAGKSYSALLLARGLAGNGGHVAALDTEHGSLSNYDQLANFDVVNLAPPYSPQRYIEVIRAAEKAGYECLIIDSLTHEWSGQGGILDIGDKMPEKNSFTKWATLTPLHQSLIDAMLMSSMHIVATVRSKTEYVLQTNDKGKQTPTKAGMAPQQRDGLEYEFTITFDLRQEDHVALCSKDRTGLFGSSVAGEIITTETGSRILDWLDGGAPELPRQQQQDVPAATPHDAGHDAERAALTADIKEAFADSGQTPQEFAHLLEDSCGTPKLSDIATEMLPAVLAALQPKPTPQPSDPEPEPEPAPQPAQDADPFEDEGDGSRRAQEVELLLTCDIPQTTAECRSLFNQLFDLTGQPSHKRIGWFTANGLPPKPVMQQEAGTLVAAIEQIRKEIAGTTAEAAA